jgi:hypothetical protein
VSNRGQITCCGEKNVLLKKLYEKRIEIKYVCIMLVLTGGLFLLVANHVFDGLEVRVNEFMDDMVAYGPLGMFLIALPSNTTLLLQVPYNLPMFSLLLYADTVWKIIWIGTATGIGAGIGEIFSYAVARAIIAKVQDIEDSALFRWTKVHIERHPGWIPYLVFLTSGVPIPDLMVIVPVAMVKYPWKKLIVPMIGGKIFQNVWVAFVFKFAADHVLALVSNDINLDLSVFIVMAFVMIIAYQIEKARLVTE